MKIVLNREEMKSLLALGNTLNSIEGLPAIKSLQDYKISKKAYVMALITGELTIETTPFFTTEFLDLINNLTVEVSPFLTALAGLFKAMAPACEKYDSKFQEFFKKYDDTPAPVKKTEWELVKVETEREVV